MKMGSSLTGTPREEKARREKIRKHVNPKETGKCKLVKTVYV